MVIPRLPLARFWAVSRPLTIVSLASVALIVAGFLGLLLDSRTITGVAAWAKPTKFGLSTALYSFTLIWMLGLVQGRGAKLARVAAGLTALGFLVELVIITVQVVRGTTSHFNVSTALDGVLYGLMGGFVLLLWTMNLLAATLLAFQKLPDRVLAQSVRLGVVLTLLGSSVGGLMTVPTSGQVAGFKTAAPSVIGAHTVGGPDGGPGLPFLGWSTAHGDLRVPHFVGLHALQMLPLLFLLLTFLGRRFGWTELQRLRLLWTGALGYLGVMALLLWQALRGQSVLAPDSLTLGVLAALIVMAGTAVGVVLRRSPSRATDSGRVG
jgi:hypothetical protein